MNSAEDMLDEMENLVDDVQLQRGSLTEEVRKLVEHARMLVAQKSALARNAIEDAMVRLRELATA